MAAEKRPVEKAAAHQMGVLTAIAKAEKSKLGKIEINSDQNRKISN